MLRHSFNGALRCWAKGWYIVLTVLNIRKGTTKIENHMSANGHWWNNVLNIISKNISAQTGFELTILKLR